MYYSLNISLRTMQEIVQRSEIVAHDIVQLMYGLFSYDELTERKLRLSMWEAVAKLEQLYWQGSLTCRTRLWTQKPKSWDQVWGHGLRILWCWRYVRISAQQCSLRGSSRYSVSWPFQQHAASQWFWLSRFHPEKVLACSTGYGCKWSELVSINIGSAFRKQVMSS